MTETRKITLQFPSLRAFLAEYGERISSEGMLLRSEAPPAAGSTVDIEVVVAAGMRLLQARGETLWSGAGAAGSGPPAAAVRFRDLDEASRRLIDKIVDQQRREGAEPFRLADVPGPREARLLDLTMPAAPIAAGPPESAAASAEPVFDLAQTPAPPAADLFESAAPSSGLAPPPQLGSPEPAPPEPIASEPSTPEPTAQAPEAPPAARVGPPARERSPERKLKAPVPLLADPEPDPFDLGPPPGVEAELEATGPALGQPSVDDEQPGATVAADLDNLFGGDEPARAPARGRTEAFPPSFVDEVEAELRATEAPGSEFLDVDTSELELQLGAPVAEPEPVSEPPREAAPAPPAEPVVQPPVDVEPEPEPEIELEPEPEIELEPELEIELEVEDAPPPEPEAAAPAIEPAPAPDIAPGPDLAARVAQAFDAAQGPETVEIPILARPAPSSPASEAPAPPPSEAPAPTPTDRVTPPAVAEPAAPRPRAGSPGPPPVEPQAPPPAASPPAPAPPISQPPASEPVAPMDDNLLSLAELRSEPPPAPSPPVELPSSAQAVRGAAGSSRHLGTWLLIALLAGALAVAGYLLWGLSRDDGAAPAPVDRAGAPAAVPERPAAPPAAPAEEAADDAGGEESSAPAAADEPSPEVESQDVEPAGAVAAPSPPSPAPTAAAEAAPADPLTGLERITWTASGSDTVLSLVADGSIERSAVELVTISGAQPRLVVKIAGVQRAFQPAVLEVGTDHVQRVRTGLHAGGELHVVVDLAAAGVTVRDLAVGGGRVDLRLGSE